jgi:S-layer homology domain
VANLLRLFSVGMTLPTLCLAATALAPLPAKAQTPTQTVFPDVPANYWAQPFIQRLAQRNILAGYPDGTFQPERAVQRDELAAIIRKAFNQPPVRQIQSGSVFRDVSEGYWAEPPIESAYEQGFMTADSRNNFRPNQPVSKVDVIRALNKGLDLTSNTPATAGAKRPMFLPMAFTSLMQPLLISRANAAPATTTPQTAKPDPSASQIVNNYYTDANRIPPSAVNEVAAATKQNIVVNYPNPKVLNPRKVATRAEIAALIHQTLVTQGKMEPLASNSPAKQYIVRANGSNKLQVN